MRNLSSKKADHFDLLPFIAILMCTLGCLLLVTMSVSALAVGPSKTLGLIPVFKKGEKLHKTPILVEWDGKQVVIHQWDGHDVVLPPRKVTPITAPVDVKNILASSGEGDLDPAFKSFLDWLGSHTDYYALIAVRPTGFEHFGVLHYVFENRRLDMGYEPFDQHQPIEMLPGAEQ